MEQHPAVAMIRRAGRALYPKDYRPSRCKQRARITVHTCPACGATVRSPTDLGRRFACDGQPAAIEEPS